MRVCSVTPDTQRSHGLQPARFLCPWDFPAKKIWKGLPFPPPGDLPDPGIELESPVSLALADEFFTTADSWEALRCF